MEQCVWPQLPTIPNVGPATKEDPDMSIPTQVATADPATAVRVAFYGRATCPVDAQEIIRRQLHSVKTTLPDDMRIACFADVAARSGLKGTRLATVGWSPDRYPVNGDMLELLEQSGEASRDFVAVACAVIDRVAKPTWVCTAIENDLAKRGVQILAADELMPQRRMAANDGRTRR